MPHHFQVVHHYRHPRPGSSPGKNDFSSSTRSASSRSIGNIGMPAAAAAAAVAACRSRAVSMDITT
jgi:hypothetical protein